MLINPYLFGTSGGGGSVTPTTYDPLNKGPGMALDGTELIVDPGTSLDSIKSRVSVSSGKYYWEVDIGSSMIVGVGTASQAVTGANSAVGTSLYSWGFYLWTSQPYHNNLLGSVIAGAPTSGTVGVYLDADAGTLGVICSGVEYPDIHTGMTGPYFAMLSGDTQAPGPTNTTNFGATAFTWTVPTGYASGFGAT